MGTRTMNHWLHGLAATAAALCVVAALVAGRSAEAPSEAPVARPGDALFFDLEVRDPDGELLSRPRVLGESGRLVRVEYRDPGETDPEVLKMCIVLDPVGAIDGLDMSIDLSVDGLVSSHHQRLRMPMGERRFLEVPTSDGRTLEVGLLAYRVDSPEFAAYLERLRAHGELPRAPEA